MSDNLSTRFREKCIIFARVLENESSPCVCTSNNITCDTCSIRNIINQYTNRHTIRSHLEETRPSRTCDCPTIELKCDVCRVTMLWGQSVFEYVYNCGIHGSTIPNGQCIHTIKNCECEVRHWQKLLDTLNNSILSFRQHTKSLHFHEERKRILDYRTLISALENHLKL